jgi:hypothetical protein
VLANPAFAGGGVLALSLYKSVLKMYKNKFKNVGKFENKFRV